MNFAKFLMTHLFTEHLRATASGISETVNTPRIYIHTTLKKKKHQEIKDLINKAKISWFILQRILYDSKGKTVNTHLNRIDTTIKPVALYGCESWGDPKEQINLSKIRFYRSHFRQIVGVKKNTCNSKMLVELKGVDTNNGSVEARFNRDFFILFVQTWYIRL